MYHQYVTDRTAKRKIQSCLMSTHMREAWGKFDREKDSTHSLAQHCMDVAAVFTRMMRLPAVGDRLDEAAGTPLDNVQRQRLSVLVFLHDIGKLHPGFQAKGWPPGSWSAPMRGHLEEGWAFLTHAFRHSEHPSTERCNGSPHGARQSRHSSPRRPRITDDLCGRLRTPRPGTRVSRPRRITIGARRPSR